ncbi:MAG: aminopeptidase, partial [Anaerolineae bacterium]|nr:aminopeptidase [Anaerolineae bacterium]
MVDPRLTKLANVLVNYCVSVQPGQWTLVQADMIAVPLAREVFRAVLRAGGHPMSLYRDAETQEMFFTEANDDQLTYVSPLDTLLVGELDVLIALRGQVNTRSMTNADSAKLAKAQAAYAVLMKTRMTRSANGTFKWTLTEYPTHASAQEAEMSLTEYEKFVFGATFVNLDDPVAEWRKVSAMQQTKVDWLKDHD